jgi:hypothetical protein
MSTPSEQAEARIDAFEKDDSVSSAWAAIPKAILIRDLYRRLQDVDGVHQMETGSCGPVALVHCLLQDSPSAFVDLAVTLYKTGRASGKGGTVEADWWMLAAPPPDGQGTPQRPRGHQQACDVFSFGAELFWLHGV